MDQIRSTGCFLFTGLELLITWPLMMRFWWILSQSIHQSLEIFTVIFVVLWNISKRHGAKRNELAVESSFSEMYTGFQITPYLGNYWFFFRMAYWTKNVFLWPFNWSLCWTGPARPGPTRRLISKTGFLLKLSWAGLFIMIIWSIRNIFLSDKSPRKSQ